MRVRIELISSKKIFLPKGYLKDIQATLIYKQLSPENAEFLHNKGFQWGKKRFKLFSFSTPLEQFLRYDRKSEVFIYPRKITVVISSPVQWILEDIAVNLIKSGEFVLSGNRISISSIGVEKRKVIKESPVEIYTLTPIEAHTTLYGTEGRRFTYYLKPFDENFSEFINANIRDKWSALYQKECPYNLSIKPLFGERKKETVWYYGTGERRTIIKGWMGRFQLEGDLELLNFAYYASLGGRNSQGFGMVEIADKEVE